MKINVAYTTALALAVILTSTGCRHKPVAVTPIGERQPANVGSDMGGTLQSEQPASSGGGIAETGPYNPDHWTQDPTALANDTIHFAYDSAVIRDNEHDNIASVAQALSQDPRANVLIQGNCDERGTEEYNRSLGERRAEAAREALVSAGVDANRIHTLSFGKDQPADHGHDEAAWAKNRRDDFILLHPKATM